MQLRSITSEESLTPVPELKESGGQKEFRTDIANKSLYQFSIPNNMLQKIPDEKYNMPVDQLELSVRTMNCLRRSGIATVGELVTKKPRDLLKLRNFGQKSFQEIEERLAEMGLSLAQESEPKKEGEEEVDRAGADTNATIELPTGNESQSGEQVS